jgi:CubicO group peptidase (beta-lactamase class C family)
MEVGERIVGAQVVTIGRGGEVRDLPPADVDPVQVAALPVRTDQWGETTVEDVLARSQARSLVVLHDGRLAYEWYGSAGAPDRRNRCYSVTKSFTGTLAAVAMHEGRLDPSATIGDLLPQLAASGRGPDRGTHPRLRRLHVGPRPRAARCRRADRRPEVGP